MCGAGTIGDNHHHRTGGAAHSVAAARAPMAVRAEARTQRRARPAESCAMTASVHPAASHYLPLFITAPGETDVLMVVTATILLMGTVGFGLLFLRIHTLPERMAHRGHKLQFEIVAVLGLLALFTHVHWFWVAGLLLALIDIPDFGGSLNRIAGGVEKIAGIEPEPASAAADERSHADTPPGDVVVTRTPESADDARREDTARTAAKRPELVPAATGS
jgi:hypothetical protein